jgi:hypothetical protein
MHKCRTLRGRTAQVVTTPLLSANIAIQIARDQHIEIVSRDEFDGVVIGIQCKNKSSNCTVRNSTSFSLLDCIPEAFHFC